MDVILAIVWEVIIDDIANVLDIETTRCNICRNKDRRMASLELA